MPLTCTNCDASLPDSAQFCPACGQSTRSFRRPFLAFVKDSLHELLDIDGRLSLTLKTLFLKPGLASYEFEQGKRAKYTPPLRVYLVASLLFFLVFSSFQHVYTNQVDTGQSTTEQYSRAMFVLFPLFALFLKVFFWRSYYLCNLVFSMHLHSVAYVVLMLVGPLESFEPQGNVFVLLQLFPVSYFIWYWLMSFKTMYRASWPITVVKAFSVYFVYMAAFGIVFDVVLVQT